MVSESVRCSSGEPSALPDPSSEELAEPFGLVDERCGTYQNTVNASERQRYNVMSEVRSLPSDGRTESLGHAQRDGIERTTQFLELETRLGHYLPHPRSVAVHNHSLRPHLVRDADDLVLGEDCPRESVLQSDDTSRCRVDVVPAHDVSLDVFEGEVVSVRRGDGERVGLGVEGDSSSFVEMDMSSRVEEDRVRGLREMSPYSQLVGLSCAEGDR